METALIEKERSAAQYFFDINRYEDALIHIKNILNHHPFDAHGLFLMAVVYLSRNDYEQARETCQEALENGYDEVICFHFIGTIYLYEKNYPSSEQSFLAALQLEPENGEVLASYGYLMLITGFEEKALALLENAVRLEPESERVNQYILEYYFAKSDSEKQLTLIKNSMELANDEDTKLINLAVFHELRDEEKEAREYYRQAFLLNPTNEYLLEILTEYDRRTHLLFLPHRLMRKMGGPAVVWFIFIIGALSLQFARQYTALMTFTVLYLLFVLYSWTAPLLYKWFGKGRL
jgi:Tfp pilus assembly protein PilF